MAQRRFGRIVQSVVDISFGRSFAKKGGTIVEMLSYRYAGGSSGWRGKEVNERIREGTRDEEKRLYNDTRECIGGGIFVLRKLSRDARDEIREKFRAAIRR